ncbi:MAG: hypothetical protein EXS05_03290 [Planctomycetaceae bacterium]|nr:hypothetical protein [Planctomycetaceae bacterium]
MNLLDRYLKGVRSFLSSSQTDDILRELSENITAQMDDQAAELGRPLTEAEQESILKQHGHPMLVAGRYQQDQRSLAFGRVLIGPPLFPLYVKVLWFNLGITAIACPVVTLALGKPLLQAVPAILSQLLIQFGIVTLIFSVAFIAAQKHLARFPDRWDPRRPLAALPLMKDESRVPRVESFAQLVALAVLLSWLLAVRHSAGLIFDPATDVFRLGPAWQPMNPTIVLLTLAGMVQACVNLLRPDWKWLASVVRFGIGVVWLILLCNVMMAGDWVVLAGNATEPAEKSRRVLQQVNQLCFYSLLVTAVCSAVATWFDIRRLLGGGGKRSQDLGPITVSNNGVTSQ